MAQLITKEELELVIGETLSSERFAALYRTGVRVVRSGYRGDPEAADPHAQEVIGGVLVGVIARIVANPKGARQLNAGGAGLTFGGRDLDVASIFTLNEEELAVLADVAPATDSGYRSGAFTIYPGG